MTDATASWLVEQIRAGAPDAWEELISRYEGRLTEFVRHRLRDQHAVDDVVQEAFLGFLRSLPHFDASRDLESYLFTIAAHKIRDHLRREGRHPLSLLGDMEASDSSNNKLDPKAAIRGPSSLLASAERVRGEEERLSGALSDMLGQWLRTGDYRRVKCIELLFVAGWANRDVAKHLEMTEQQVANFKFQAVERLSRRTQS